MDNTETSFNMEPNTEPNTEPSSKKRKKRRKRKTWEKVLLVILLVACTSVVSFFMGLGYLLTSATGSGAGAILKKLATMQMLVQNYYLYEEDAQAIENGMYKGFVSGLGDDYAEYYTPEEYADLMEEDSGEYKGIGVSIYKDKDSGYATISQVFKKSPSYKAGLLPGDYIIKVGEQDTSGLELKEVVQAIKTSENDLAHLTMLRDVETFEVDVEVSNVVVESVEYEMKEDDIGYISVSEFIENTGVQFSDAVDALEDKGMKKLIIDLRDNGGGLVDVCVDMVSRIIPENDLVVYIQDKNDNRRDYVSNSADTLKIPIIILTNEYTASASEIFTGCLKDYGLATVVGKKTFGKGIVQNLIKLYDESAVKFTTASYYTPNGICIHGEGIEPDVTIEQSEEEEVAARTDASKDKVLKEALKLIKEK